MLMGFWLKMSNNCSPIRELQHILSSVIFIPNTNYLDNPIFINKYSFNDGSRIDDENRGIVANEFVITVLDLIFRLLKFQYDKCN